MSKLPSVERSTKEHQKAPVATGYCSRTVDVKMNANQALLFRAIIRQLEDQGAMLKDGSPVTNKRRAVLYLIENFAG